MPDTQETTEQQAATSEAAATATTDNATPTPQQTLEQRRANAAWEDVESVSNERFKKQYGTVVRKLPMLVLTNGLGQTIAFIKAKSTPKPGKPPTEENKANAKVYQHLSGWVMGELQPGGDLLTWIREKSSAEYRRATTETLAFLNWLKRFVEAAGLGEGEG